MPTNILNDNNWTTGFVVHFQTNPFGIFSWVGFGLGMWVYMVPKNFMVAGLYSKQMPTSLRHCTHKPTWHSMGHKFVGIWQPDDQNSWTFFQTPKLFDDHNGFSTPQKNRDTADKPGFCFWVALQARSFWRRFWCLIFMNPPTS